MTKCETCQVVLTEADCVETTPVLTIDRYETLLAQTAYDAVNQHESWD